MAVRNDFTAGEVLAAADLNDTFASKLPYSFGTATPSTTDSGFLWYDSNSTPADPKFWDGSAFVPIAGLTLVTQETFSAVSSVSVNGVFTSTYQSYRVVLRATNANNATVTFRWRNSGSDNSGANYFGNRDMLSQTAGETLQADDAATSFQFAFNGTGVTHLHSVFDVVGVQNINYKAAILGQSVHSVATSYGSMRFAMVFNGGNNFDGFSLINSSGTFSGDLFIYGYRD